LTGIVWRARSERGLLVIAEPLLLNTEKNTGTR